VFTVKFGRLPNLIRLHAFTLLVTVWKIWWVRWQFKNPHSIGWLWCTGKFNVLIANFQIHEDSGVFIVDAAILAVLIVYVQEGWHEDSAWSRNICKALQEYSNGWHGDCSCKIDHYKLYPYIAVSSSFYLHPWLLSVTWTRTYFIAREEKPDTNTDGLGQVSHFCCYRFGMFLMVWLSNVQLQ